MKHLAAFALAASSVFAADFVTGQAARAVIGQQYFTSQDSVSSDTILGGVSGIAYANGMLVAADANRISASPLNNRVVIYRNVDTEVPAPTAEVTRNGLQRCPLCGFKADVVLGQTDFKKFDWSLTQTGMRLPTAVATDGVRVAVADTDNNRVLVWNSIPATNGAPADLVLGQPDFTSGAPNNGTGDVRVPSARTFRGPQGVWIQNGKLFVADDQNDRVLIWNTFPTQNFQPADVVLGQPNFTSAIDPNKNVPAAPATLLNPVAVSSDGVRLFVTDLGHNRVLIWNTIPSQSNAPADIAIGQPDLNSGISNNSFTLVSGTIQFKSVLCLSNGTDANGNATYPARCGATLDFPRYALSDGTRLFIADGGNDRVLVFNSIPTQNGAKADVVLGQVNDTFNQVSDSGFNPDIMRRSAADAVRTPSSLAWDGTNLYVSEPYSRRVLVFTPGSSSAVTPVRNAASLEVFAVGTVTLSGTVKENDEVKLKIKNDKEYSYKAKKDDTLGHVAIGLTDAINAGKGDPWMLAGAIPSLAQVRLTARHGGPIGNDIPLEASSSNTALLISAGRVSGGGDAAQIAAGSLITIFGQNFATQESSALMGANPLPQELGGVQVYVDGLRIPLLYVGPTQINAQLPFEVLDASSANLYVRMKRADGSVAISNAVGVPVIPANPGLFAAGGTDPRPGTVVHSSSKATGTVSVDGTPKAGDEVQIIIRKDAAARTYKYTVKTGDTLVTIRDAFIADINAHDPEVEAYPGGQFQRVRLRARVSGPTGNGIPFSTKSTGNVIMSAYSNALCCANTAGALVTASNPAVPGETITVFGTGLGMINDPAKFNVHTGMAYRGPYVNTPDLFVSSLAGGKTANTLYAGMMQGAVGIYQLDLELNPDLPTDPVTQLTVAQDVYVSNIITFPVKKP